MNFRNQSGVDLDFEIGGVRYGVPVAGTVEIPDRVAYCVKLHGLPLAEVAQTEETEDSSASIGSFNFDPPKPIPSRKKN